MSIVAGDALKHFESRRDRWEFYNAFSSPFLNITLRFECADFMTACKAKGVPVFHFLLHQICRATLATPAFRLRWNGKEIVEEKTLHPSYTVTSPDGALNFATFDFADDWTEFLERSLAAKAKAEAAPRLQLDAPGRVDYLFCTCMPWFDFTSIQHPVDAKQNHTIPSYAIGRIRGKDGRLEMPLSIQVHHGLVDGAHVREFLANLERGIEDAAERL